MGVDVLQRTRELGVMRAIGATPEAIAQLLRRESVVVSVLAVGFGVLLAVPLTAGATTFFGALMLGDGARLEFAWSATGLGVTLLTTFSFGGWRAGFQRATRFASPPTRRSPIGRDVSP